MRPQAAGAETLGRLCRGLDDALREPEVGRLTSQVKARLVELGASLGAALPEHFHEPAREGYARRLLTRGAAGYSIVVMTWGPGQGTPLHDHAGMWCVECVIRGEIDVTQYDLLEERDGRARFTPRVTQRARVGDAGALIPPFEYHVLTNPRADAVAITLHVYGGEMERCNAYLPQADGWWRREPRSLDYVD